MTGSTTGCKRRLGDEAERVEIIAHWCESGAVAALQDVSDVKLEQSYVSTRLVGRVQPGRAGISLNFPCKNQAATKANITPRRRYEPSESRQSFK